MTVVATPTPKFNRLKTLPYTLAAGALSMSSGALAANPTSASGGQWTPPNNAGGINVNDLNTSVRDGLRAGREFPVRAMKVLGADVVAEGGHGLGGIVDQAVDLPLARGAVEGQDRHVRRHAAAFEGELHLGRS